MLTLEQIKTRIQKMEPARWSELVNMPEIQKLPQVLLQGESLEAATKGTFQKSSGLVIATNHRILFIDATSWTPFPYMNLTSIKYRSSIEFKDGSLLGTLTLLISGNPIAFNKVPANGSDFAKRVRSLLEEYTPDSDYGEGEGNHAPHRRTRKGLFVLAAAMVLCLASAYVFMGVKDTKSPPTFAVKVDEFSQHWNEAGKELGSPYQIEDVQVVKDGNLRSFSHYLTEDLKIMGTLALNGRVSKLIVLGDAEKTLPLITEQSITAIQPGLTPPERQVLLRKLGLMEGNIDMEDRQISQSGVRYSVTYSDKLGVIFEAAPTLP